MARIEGDAYRPTTLARQKDKGALSTHGRSSGRYIAEPTKALDRWGTAAPRILRGNHAMLFLGSDQRLIVLFSNIVIGG
jgi:hypothetical protein